MTSVLARRPLFCEETRRSVEDLWKCVVQAHIKLNFRRAETHSLKYWL